MKIFRHVIFWLTIMVFFTILFGSKWNNFALTFYFFSLLLPIAVGTSYFFNYFLVPQFLLSKKYFLFGLYSVYLIIVSVYLEMLAILFAFIVISNYQYRIISPITTDVFVLAMVIYFIVLLQSIYLFTVRFDKKQKVIDELQKVKSKNHQTSITVLAERKHHQLLLEQILFFESLSDYVKIVTLEHQIITKERISQFELQLPANFIRIHRSFIVNRNHIKTFTREMIEIREHKLPISRKYKPRVMNILAEEIPTLEN